MHASTRPISVKLGDLGRIAGPSGGNANGRSRRWRSLAARNQPGDLAGQVLPVIVVDAEGPQVGVAREALYGPNVAVGFVEGFGDGAATQAVGARFDLHRAPKGLDDPIHSAPG